MRVAAVGLLLLLGAGCSSDHGTDGVYVGSISVSKSISVNARCVDGSERGGQVQDLVLAPDAQVELPRGDFAFGGGVVDQVVDPDLEVIRRTTEAYDFDWEVEITDGEIARLGPWFASGCVN